MDSTKGKTITAKPEDLEGVTNRKIDDPTINKIVIDHSTTSKESKSWFDWASNWRWKPTSLKELEETEREMLQNVGIEFEQSLVKVEIPNTETSVFVNTLKTGSGPPLLLLHGFAAGIGLWAGNLEALSEHNTVYAIDLVGFGRSTRHPFTGKTPEEAEEYFIEMIENWRQSSKLEGKINLLGHSFGGYLAGTYSLRYPENVNHLFMIDPWGLPHQPDDAEKNYPLKWRVAKSILTSFSPLATVRALGPWGPGLVSRFRADLSEKFWHLHESDIVTKYIYHINAQEPHGENAFALLSKNLAWASRPLEDKLTKLDKNVGLTMVYGDQTWMDVNSGRSVAARIGQKQARLYVVPDAGHHCYIDNWHYFNTLISKELVVANKKFEIKESK